jgi:hypothetical protein
MASEHAFAKQTQCEVGNKPSCKDAGARHQRKTFADKKERPPAKVLIRSEKEVGNELEGDFAAMACCCFVALLLREPL